MKTIKIHETGRISACFLYNESMNNKLSLTISSFGHFLVDFTCAYVVLSRLHEASDTTEILIIYNFLAFAMQMPFGVLADAHPDFKWSILGTLCVMAALLPLPVFASVVLIGCGNALYHLGEGKPILDHLKGSAALGIFVAPGAFGITFGTMMANSALTLRMPLMIALAITLFLLSKRKYEGEPDAAQPKTHWPLAFALFAVVILRSFVGFSWQLVWKADHLVALTFCVVMGKALGGILADKIGSRNAALLSLLLSFLCFLKADFFLTGLLGVLFFNMTMPICLKQMTLELNNRSGFAFGLLTFALFLGYLPSVLGISTIPMTQTLTLIAVSLLCMGFIRRDKA